MKDVSGHEPVMLEEIIHWLDLKPGSIILDCTVGYCGHAEKILESTAPDGALYGIDRDPEALNAARTRLGRFGTRIITIHGSFADLKWHLAGRGVSRVDGVLFDLGVSSPQLDNPARGFSFQTDGPLDMRMDPTTGPTAADIVNSTDEADLADLIYRFGEERFARRIARSIVRARSARPIGTSGELVAIIRDAVPAHYRHGRLHYATRTFQGLRIAVNAELDQLESALLDAVDVLSPRGRLCVISFHSLEDRIVKRTYRSLSESRLQVLTKKPQMASENEVLRNPRSRSAKLRVAERLELEGRS
ncbi:16S rRNA (cytosine(1402)-N(4))-methyltransferase RsmH [Nitrospira sp. KM1]|uniref:16S rRNA (cytosine(1402)-N(4))-methyltransferase RsmH n=1 Tax=Nitrospira sp. KM1 TaxID=1936990 RepID=UPI00351A3B35